MSRRTKSRRAAPAAAGKAGATPAQAGLAPAPAGPAPAPTDQDYEEGAAFARKARSYYAGLPEVDEETGERWIPYDFELLAADVLRYAQTIAGAPKRCRRLECREGGCRLRLEDGDAVCKGGIGAGQLDDAARMIGFLLDLSKRRWPAFFA